jgi:hypothetical protein
MTVGPAWDSRVDRHLHIIRGVRICGWWSMGRNYTRKAFKDALARGLYEGAPCYWGHARHGGRAVPGVLGLLWRVFLDHSGLAGDLHFLPDHPRAGDLVEAALENRQDFGLSHSVQVERWVHTSGIHIADRIVWVASVDVVENPGSTRGLFET